MLVPSKSPNATSYWLLILIDILSCTVSKLSQIIVQIWDEKWPLCIFEPPFGLLGATYTVHLRLTGKLVVNFLTELFWLHVMAEALQVNIDWKLAFLKEEGQFCPIFQMQGVFPYQPFFLSENYADRSFIPYKNVGISFFCFITVHAFDRQMDGLTDISLMAKTTLHRWSAVIKLNISHHK